MELKSVVSFFMGYVEILVRGPQLEKFINLVTNSNLYLWEVRRLGPEALQAKIRAHGFLRLRPFLKKSGSTVRIFRKRGWPFLIRKLLRRKGFFLAAVFFVGLLFFLSSFIFFIKVEGFKGEDQKHLLSSLEKAGLKPGILRKDLLKKKFWIEREVMIETPQAVWLGINIRGVVAVVKVVPRKTAPVPMGICDVVAAREGVISKIVVFRGNPLVKEGDTVAYGEILISGTVWHTNPQTQEVTREDFPASGKVEARVWYDLEVIEPKIVWEPVLLNQEYREYKLRWGRKIWTLFRSGKKDSGKFSLTRFRKRIYQGRNMVDVVELIKDTWRKTSWRRCERSMQEIAQSARLAINSQKKFLPVSENSKQEETWSDQGNFLKLTVTYETTEDIAMIVFRGKGNQ